MAVPTHATLAERPWDALRSDSSGFFRLLDTHLGVRVPGFLDPDTCARLSRRVYDGRPFWISDFGGVQFSLGRAWYTHLEQDREDEYFAQARTSDAQVERFLPGLQARLRDALSALVGAPTVSRPGWCGPGVHIFPAGQWLSHHGGDIHFDTEGLSETQCQRRSRAITLVLMLQPPESGGALRLWDVTYEGSDEVPEELPSIPSVDVNYATGDLVLLDSYRLHQIQPFLGSRDRISATAHAALEESRAVWEVWF
ncbi:2OG-Fe(II) oxygenase family protein [Hyalangium gracile]|uniref:2OG-Fe(II) oxygenase family protein n=1 Tax=Hyalangium gracile TaxID=394092 RepID=UPI001CCE0A0E|nr:2OG-Fe(II) oxygenase [Hyalangium gracile]